MSRSHYQENCRECRPCLIDQKTGRTLPDDDPVMKAMMLVWDQASRKERKAFHNVCCNNSRLPKDMHHSMELTKRMEIAMKGSSELLQ